MTHVRSRPALAAAARLFLVATIILVVDIRLPTFDVVADAVGGVLVLVAASRARAAIEGVDGARSLLVGLAVVALPVSVLETFAPLPDALGLLALSQLAGALVLARLLADALARSDPGLAATWHRTFLLIGWLGLAPYLAGVLLGSALGEVRVESPLALVLIVVLAIPLGALLRALHRTSGLREVEPAVAGPVGVIAG